MVQNKNSYNINDYVPQKIIDAIHSQYNPLPYHNFNHALSVTRRCLYNYLFKSLSKEWKQALVFAALLHDANHQGLIISEDDTINIHCALKVKNQIFKQFRNDIGSNLQCRRLSRMVSQLIQATNSNPNYKIDFPIENADQLIALNILRDADLTQTLTLNPTWRQALSKELGIPITIKSTLKWLEDVTVYTKSGRKQVQKFKDAVKRTKSYNKE